MEKIDRLPPRGSSKGESRFPDELFDGDVYVVTPEEFGYKSVNSLRSTLVANARKDGQSSVAEQQNRLGVEKVSTRDLGDGRIAVQAVVKETRKSEAA